MHLTTSPVDWYAARAAGVAAYLLLSVVVCLGMNLMAMGRTLLLVYIAIEIVSVVSFVLAGSRRAGAGGAAGEGRRSSEARNRLHRIT